MKQILILVLIAVCTVGYARSQGNLSEGYGYLADRCKDLTCIQQNLLMIDGQIAALVAKRLAFVKRSAMIKKGSVLLENKPGFGANPTDEGAQAAEFLGYDKGVGSSVFKSIHKQSDAYEKQFYKEGQ